MEVILGVGGVGIALALVVYALGTQVEERATIRSSLRRLDGFDLQNTRDQELLAPLRKRAVSPIVKNIVGTGRRVTPAGFLESVRHKHVQAGIGDPAAVDKFLVQKMLGILFVPFGLWLTYGYLGLSGSLGLAMAGLLSGAGIVGPDAILNRKVEERTFAIRVALPDVLDLLVISVEAGLGFEQALDRVVDAVPGPLTDEFRRMLGEVRAGSSRSDAMRAMEKRIDVPEVRSFILAMLQADTFGVSIGRVLRAQAEEMRIKRRQYAQERAQKAPVKMLIPMVFCIFPALFVVILGPAILQIRESF